MKIKAFLLFFIMICSNISYTMTDSCIETDLFLKKEGLKFDHTSANSYLEKALQVVPDFENIYISSQELLNYLQAYKILRAISPQQYFSLALKLQISKVLQKIYATVYNSLVHHNEAIAKWPLGGRIFSKTFFGLSLAEKKEVSSKFQLLLQPLVEQYRSFQKQPKFESRFLYMANEFQTNFYGIGRLVEFFKNVRDIQNFSDLETTIKDYLVNIKIILDTIHDSLTAYLNRLFGQIINQDKYRTLHVDAAFEIKIIYEFQKWISYNSHIIETQLQKRPSTPNPKPQIPKNSPDPYQKYPDPQYPNPFSPRRKAQNLD
jgi:hypothetical protein